MARQAQGDKIHCRQAPKGGKKQKPKGETKLEASCSAGAALGGQRGTSTAGVPLSISSRRLFPPVLPCPFLGWG